MKQVTISLEADVASAYLRAMPDVRKKAETLVNLWLKDIFNQSDDPRKELTDAIKVVSRIAQSKGLTPKILEQILNEKE